MTGSGTRRNFAHPPRNRPAAASASTGDYSCDVFAIHKDLDDQTLAMPTPAQPGSGRGGVRRGCCSGTRSNGRMPSSRPVSGRPTTRQRPTGTTLPRPQPHCSMWRRGGRDPIDHRHARQHAGTGVRRLRGPGRTTRTLSIGSARPAPGGQPADHGPPVRGRPDLRGAGGQGDQQRRRDGRLRVRPGRQRAALLRAAIPEPADPAQPGTRSSGRVVATAPNNHRHVRIPIPNPGRPGRIADGLGL